MSRPCLQARPQTSRGDAVFFRLSDPARNAPTQLAQRVELLFEMAF